MAWTQHTLIYKTDGSQPWSNTHTQVPTALVLEDRIRLYYATRDEKGRSLTSFIDVDRTNLSKIIYQHDKPVLELGAHGTHDEDGVMSGCVVQNGTEILAYYTGWSRCQTVPYRVTVGLAKSIDNGTTFQRVFQGPVVDRTSHEPYMTMSPYVLKTGDLWQMWYGSGTGWVEIDGKMEPLYQVKYAESADGQIWKQDNITCIEVLHQLEANTRPSVLKTANGYEMWFSYRHSVGFRNGVGGYRIGYATSPDGKIWQRQDDQPGLEIANSPWTRTMVAYPNVIELNGQKIMFYNGDGFGQSGFGYAIWQE